MENQIGPGLLVYLSYSDILNCLFEQIGHPFDITQLRLTCHGIFKLSDNQTFWRICLAYKMGLPSLPMHAIHDPSLIPLHRISCFRIAYRQSTTKKLNSTYCFSHTFISEKNSNFRLNVHYGYLKSSDPTYSLKPGFYKYELIPDNPKNRSNETKKVEYTVSHEELEEHGYLLARYYDKNEKIIFLGETRPEPVQPFPSGWVKNQPYVFMTFDLSPKSEEFQNVVGPLRYSAYSIRLAKRIQHLQMYDSYCLEKQRNPNFVERTYYFAKKSKIDPDFPEPPMIYTLFPGMFDKNKWLGAWGESFAAV